MTAVFPAGSDNVVNNATNATPQAGIHSQLHNQLADAVNAIEHELLPGGTMSLAGHTGAADPHPQYLTQSDGDALYAPKTGGGYLTQAQADARYAQLTAPDPFPQYLTQSEANALYAPVAGGGYLPLSGGTMSGSLLFSAGDIGAVDGNRPNMVYANAISTWNDVTVGYHLIFNYDGGPGDLSVGYASDAYTGFYKGGTGNLTFQGNGNPMLALTPGLASLYGHLRFATDNTYDVGASGAFRPRNVYAAGAVQAAGAVVTQSYFDGGAWVYTGGSGPMLIQPNNSNTLEQRNGTNPQTLRIYNTYASPSTYERLELLWSSNSAYIRTQGAGTGIQEELRLDALRLRVSSGGLTSWIFWDDGRILAATDNTFDIGQSGASRPRTIYAGTSVVTPQVVTPLIGTTTAALLQFTVNGNVVWLFNMGGTFQPATDNTNDIGWSGGRPRSIYAGTSFIGPGALPTGGITGQVLQKNSAANYDVGWVTPSGGGGGLTLPLGQALTFAPDATYDIGTSSANRPRSLYLNGGQFTTFNPNSGVANNATNYERLELIWIGNNATIHTTAGGSGAYRDMQFDAPNISFITAGAYRWQINSSGHMLAQTDNAYDIGASGATRPRDLYLAGTARVYALTVQGAGISFNPDNNQDIGSSGSFRPRDLFLTRSLTFSAVQTPFMYGPAYPGSPVGQLTYTNRDYNQATYFYVAPSGPIPQDAGLRVLGLFDVANAPYGQLRVTGNTVQLEAYAFGTGTLGPVVIRTNNTDQLRVDTAGKVTLYNGGLVWNTDNAQDIGQSGSNRPRDLFLARNLSVGGAFTMTGALSVGSLTVTNNAQVSGILGVGTAPVTGQDITIRSNGIFAFFDTNHFITAGSSNQMTFQEWGGLWVFQSSYAPPDSRSTRQAALSANNFNLYNLYTDGSNYERGVIGWTANTFRVGTDSVGTGAQRNLELWTANAARWRIDTSGMLLAVTDNTFDIGAAAGNRPRDLFLARNLVLGTGSPAPSIHAIVALPTWLAVEAPNGASLVGGKIAGYIAGNAYWDGSAWQRYDTAQAAALVGASPSGVAFFGAPGGANPISFTSFISMSPGGALTLPSNSITTPMLAPNAVQQAVGSWNAGIGTWTNTTVNTWMNTAVYANFTSTGGLLRCEFSSSFGHSVANAQMMVGMSIDTVASPFVYWFTNLSATAGMYSLLSGISYVTVGAGAHTIYLVIFMYSPGTLTQYGSGYHTLFVTEQKR